MEMLAEMGMTRKSGRAWLAITPGRLEPSMRRAIAVLLARRADLPPALAAELDSWKLTLYTLEAPGGTLPHRLLIERAARQPTPAPATAGWNESGESDYQISCLA
jgi:hypothetical protein